MLFSNATPDFSNFVLVVSLLLGATTSVLIIVYYIKQIFFTEKIEEIPKLNKEDLKDILEKDTLKDFQNINAEARKELKVQVDTLSNYTHDSIHQLRIDLQVISNRLALLDQRMQENVIESIKRLESRFEQNNKELNRTGHKVDVLLNRSKKVNGDIDDTD